MEGYMKKYTNLIYGWKNRYFVLSNGILTYYDEKGGPEKGRIHLKISNIEPTPIDPCRIIINSGTKNIHLRCNSIPEKIKWMNGLRGSKEEMNKHEENLNKIRNSALRPEVLDDFLKKNSLNNLDLFQEVKEADTMFEITTKLNHIWELQIKFDKNLYALSSLTDGTNPKIVDIIEKLSNGGSEIIKSVTSMVKTIEDEKKKLSKMIKKIENNIQLQTTEQGIESLKKGQTNLSDEKSEKEEEEEEGEEKKMDEIPEDKKASGQYQNEADNNTQQDEFASFETPNQSISKSILVDASLPPDELIKPQAPKMDSQTAELLDYLKAKDPLKFNIISTSPAYKDPIFPDEKKRMRLPVFKSPDEKVNVWAVIKDCIGKDLTKFSVPVYLNEPLSMLQRFAEQFEYSELLDKAAKMEDSCLRMACVVAFAFSPYSSTINRTKKPFNPILGETFEYVDEERKFRIISEQVSHHPPISAGYAESPNYKYWANTNVKTVFWGKSMEFRPLGVAHLVLEKYNDHIIFTKAVTSAENLLIGNLYIDNHGEMNFTNLTTNETATLNLTKRGWAGKGAYECNGLIKDSEGNPRYSIKARWDKFLSVTDVKTNEEKMIWERNLDFPPDHEQQYYFTKLTLQLNYINKELLRKIPHTDCRLRPDQRALELGDLKTAIEEKNRLEEKQRSIRKVYEQTKKEWKPRWFKEEIDDFTKLKNYVYIGGYWEEREKESFMNLPDIF